MINMRNVKIYETARIVGIDNIEFGDNIIIDDFVFIYAKKKIKISNYVHIGSFSSITGGDEVVFDDFSGLSMGCRIFTGTEDFSGCGFGNPTIPEEYRNVKRAPVRIGRFAVLGANTVVLPGVTVGEGVTVGANSVVTTDLESWGVYVGNKRIRERDKDGVLDNYRRFLKSQGLKGKG
jgi:acetyltransferase-like isoleucine patch superfamily enzyme